MYKKSKSVSANKMDLSNYVENNDIYNSSLLSILKDLDKEDYLIKTFEYRPDLIAKDIYGSSDYMGILVLTCGISLENYEKGRIIQVIPKTKIDYILKDYMT